MKVMLILNKGQNVDYKLIVRLHTNTLKRKVSALLNNKREKEAFDLIVSKAIVETYLPPGIKPRIKPKWTLIEDLL